MPSALVAALAAPIRDLQSLVGSGDSGAGPGAALAGVRDGLADVSAAVGAAWNEASAQWRGAGADGAGGFMASTIAAADALAATVDDLGIAAGEVASAVATARERLRAIIERFEARATALEPYLDSPGTAEELLAEAQRSLSEAIAVVEELQGELDGHASTLTATAAPSLPASTAPAGFGATSGGFPHAMGATPSGLGAMPSIGSGLGDLAAFAPDPSEAVQTPDAARFGDGVAVRLPDGSTAMAPNAVAASAVRHALTQLGVPYHWGGTTPGVGLDCSGLTQWAYHEAGLNIPRLAQQQDVGAAVSANDLRPGDLAVWDGHVAMIVGNGMMIEAGDPVQLSPVRTTNAGQGFHGFFRPTA